MQCHRVVMMVYCALAAALAGGCAAHLDLEKQSPINVEAIRTSGVEVVTLDSWHWGQAPTKGGCSIQIAHEASFYFVIRSSDLSAQEAISKAREALIVCALDIHGEGVFVYGDVREHPHLLVAKVYEADSRDSLPRYSVQLGVFGTRPTLL